MSAPPEECASTAAPSEAGELARLQRWLQAAIVDPATTVPSSSAAPPVESVLTASPTQTAAERLAIYQRSYQVRLFECLRAVFPALRHALGEGLFDRFAGDYLQRHPPASYTLALLAADFPAYLAATRPDAGLPDEERAPWADLLVELAAVELAVQQVYDGDGLEAASLPRVDEVVALAPSELLARHFVPSPSLRLLHLAFPVHAFIAAVHRGESPALPSAQPTPLAIVRRDWRVRLWPLFEQQHILLAALAGGTVLGEALAAATRGPWESIDPAVLRGWLRGWLDEWFFAGVGR